MSPARPPLPLAEALHDVADSYLVLDQVLSTNPEDIATAKRLREAAAVLDALYDALAGIEHRGEGGGCPECAWAPPSQWDSEGHTIGCPVGAALARARQAAP